MTQLSFLDFPPIPHRDSPRTVGERAAKACLEKAKVVAAFDSHGAAKFITGYLARHGKTSGEDLTDAAIAHGFRPHDGRAFGPVYAGLVRKNLIRCVGSCLRRNGHQAAGGRVWDLVR